MSNIIEYKVFTCGLRTDKTRILSNVGVPRLGGFQRQELLKMAYFMFSIFF